MCSLTLSLERQTDRQTDRARSEGDVSQETRDTRSFTLSIHQIYTPFTLSISRYRLVARYMLHHPSTLATCLLKTPRSLSHVLSRSLTRSLARARARALYLSLVLPLLRLSIHCQSWRLGWRTRWSMRPMKPNQTPSISSATNWSCTIRCECECAGGH